MTILVPCQTFSSVANKMYQENTNKIPRLLRSVSLELGSCAKISQEKAPHTQGRAVAGNRQICKEAFGICKFCQVLASHGQRAKIRAAEKSGEVKTG